LALGLSQPEHPNPKLQVPEVIKRVVNKSGKIKKATGPGRGRNLRNSSASQQATNNAESVGWAVKDSVSGRKWEFSKNTTFESFWNTIGAEEGDIWWYQGVGMMKEVALSVEDEFNAMQNIALSSWTQDNTYLRIRKAVQEDFVEDN
jgi:hypothetical protein